MSIENIDGLVLYFNQNGVVSVYKMIFPVDLRL